MNTDRRIESVCWNLANHNRCKQLNEPIRTRRENMTWSHAFSRAWLEFWLVHCVTTWLIRVITLVLRYWIEHRSSCGSSDLQIGLQVRAWVPVRLLNSCSLASIALLHTNVFLIASFSTGQQLPFTWTKISHLAHVGCLLTSKQHNWLLAYVLRLSTVVIVKDR